LPKNQGSCGSTPLMESATLGIYAKLIIYRDFSLNRIIVWEIYVVPRFDL